MVLSFTKWKSSIFLAVVLAIQCNAQSSQGKRVSKQIRDDPLHDLCANVFCSSGRECSVINGIPECRCIEECNEPPVPVCGSDGKTYVHECELYRLACKHSLRLEVSAPVSCEMAKILQLTEKKEDPAEARPVVCYLTDRNKLRARAIEWLMAQMHELKTEEKSYKKVLQHFFKVIDQNRNLKIESMEFMKLFEENKTIAEDLSDDIHTNPVLRGYCVDALIAMSDKNQDWRLSWSEFTSCLDPELVLEELECELEDKNYKDRAEIQQECNTCVCACGNWVCTALECDLQNKTKLKLSEKQKQSTKV